MRRPESIPSISADLQERLTSLESEIVNVVNFKKSKPYVALEPCGEDGVAILGNAAGLSILGVCLLNHALVFAPKAAGRSDQFEGAGVCWSANRVELVAPFEDRYRVLRWGTNEILDELKQAPQVDKPTSARTYLIVAAVVMVILLPWIAGVVAIWHWVFAGNP